LCAVISAVIAMILFVFSIMTDSNDAALCATLTASIIGFIRFNWRPARMYLGDSGSMFLGLLLAVISLRLDWTGSNFIAGIVSPLAVLAIPLFELCFVVGSRLRLSLPLHKGSPDHSAIRLLMHGFSIDTIAYLGMGVTLLSGMAGILVAMGNATSASIVGAMGAGGCCVAGVWLWRLKPMRKKAAKAFASSRTIYHGEE
jgi:UDP-GlcNAc:undecaprenyl-phosphate/decaprenyl-phosphate GlcNAc-1-phosphate transferase